MQHLEHPILSSLSKIHLSIHLLANMHRSDRAKGTELSFRFRAVSTAFLSRPYLIEITILAVVLIIVTAATTSAVLTHHQRIPLATENITFGPPIQLAIDNNFPD